MKLTIITLIIFILIIIWNINRCKNSKYNGTEFYLFKHCRDEHTTSGRPYINTLIVCLLFSIIGLLLIYTIQLK